MTDKEPYELVLMHHEPGITSGCATCRKILRTGTWAVGLKIGTHNYVVGENPPITCCGTEKNVVQAFASEAEARQLSRETDAILREDGSTLNLVLYEAYQFISTAAH